MVLQTNPSSQILTDVSLPAVFMPSKGANINIFNPRAHDYFHATGYFIIIILTFFIIKCF